MKKLGIELPQNKSKYDIDAANRFFGAIQVRYSINPDTPEEILTEILLHKTYQKGKGKIIDTVLVEVSKRLSKDEIPASSKGNGYNYKQLNSKEIPLNPTIDPISSEKDEDGYTVCYYSKSDIESTLISEIKKVSDEVFSGIQL